MAIVTDDVALLSDFTKDKSTLESVLNQLERRAGTEKWAGKSKQFSAHFAALRELVSTRHGRTYIIFQTDGDEWDRLRDLEPRSAVRKSTLGYGLHDIVAAADRCACTIYAVMPGERLLGLSKKEIKERGERMTYRFWRDIAETSDKKALQESLYRQELSSDFVSSWTSWFLNGQAAAVQAAVASGGWAVFLERQEQAEEIYRRILSDMNHRYLIGYYPANDKHDGTKRHVKIEVRGNPDYVVHRRTSYIAQKE